MERSCNGVTPPISRAAFGVSCLLTETARARRPQPTKGGMETNFHRSQSISQLHRRRPACLSGSGISGDPETGRLQMHSHRPMNPRGSLMPAVQCLAMIEHLAYTMHSDIPHPSVQPNSPEWLIHYLEWKPRGLVFSLQRYRIRYIG